MSFITPEFIASQGLDLPISVTAEMCKGATFIVTGSNIGLGLEAARHLVSLGSTKVILAVRDTQAGEAAKKDIEATTGKTGIAEVWALDLSSYSSVKAFAKRAIQELDRLDALVENAGTALDKWSVSEGHETSITVNVISTMLLGVLLFPKLMETAKTFGVLPHLVILTSALGLTVESETEALRKGGLRGLDDQSKANMRARYSVSKMLEIFVVFRFADLYPVSQTSVVVNTVNPGLVQTGLTRHLEPGARDAIESLRAQYARTAEMGSRTLLHAMAAGKDSHGSYLNDCKVKNDEVPSWMTDPSGKQLQEQIWTELSNELEMIEPGCIGRLQ